MSEKIKSPFLEYKPPDIKDVFTANFKRELLDYKIACIAASVHSSLLKDGNIQKVLEGLAPIKVSYNVESIKTLGLLGEGESELDCVAQGVREGFEAAFDAAESETDMVAIAVKGEFKDDDPYEAVIKLRVVGEDF